MAGVIVARPKGGGGGGGGTPAGLNKEFQINNAGAFGPASGLTWNTAKSAIDSSLTFADGIGGTLISVMDSTVLNVGGDPITIRAGAGNGASSGGDATLQAGDRGTSGGGGNAVLRPGMGDSSANDGKVQIINPTSGRFIAFDTNSIATTDKTYILPNADGTIALLSNIIVRSVFSISTPTTAGSATLTDYIYLVSGTTTVTLPTAVGNTNRYVIKNVGVATVTIATTSSQTIDGSLTASLPVRYTSLELVSDGSNWNII